MPSFGSLSGVSGFGAPSGVRISNYNRPSQGRNPTEILAMVCSKTCGYFCSPCTWIPTQVQSPIVLNWVISTNYREARENPGARSQQRSYSKLTLSTSVLQGLALKKRNPSFSTDTSLHSSASLSWAPPFKEQLSFKQTCAACRDLRCAFGPRAEGESWWRLWAWGDRNGKCAGVH